MNVTINNKLSKNLNVLIAEGGSHYKILEQIYHLLTPHCNLTFYLTDTKSYRWQELFPSSEKTRIITCHCKGIFFFAKLLALGWRYDVICITTGPDGDHWTELIRIMCFYMCCLVYGKKTILAIRNTYPYMNFTPGLFARLRSKAIRFLKRFTFETGTLRDEFAKTSAAKGAFLGVSYDRYTDVKPSVAHGLEYGPGDLKIKIGLLGTVSEERRDYGILCDALEYLSAEQRSRLGFVTLGACTGGANHKVVKSLSRLVEVDCREGTLSELEFHQRGRSCALLISPLDKKKPYGTLTGSGSFGDVMYLRKKLILPSFADPQREFEEVCLYYSNASELSRILAEVELHLSIQTPDSFYERFTTQRVYESLVRDLRIAKMCAEKG